MDRTKGNCIACHMIPGGAVPGHHWPGPDRHAVPLSDVRTSSVPRSTTPRSPTPERHAALRQESAPDREGAERRHGLHLVPVIGPNHHRRATKDEQDPCNRDGHRAGPGRRPSPSRRPRRRIRPPSRTTSPSASPMSPRTTSPTGPMPWTRSGGRTGRPSRSFRPTRRPSPTARSCGRPPSPTARPMPTASRTVPASPPSTPTGTRRRVWSSPCTMDLNECREANGEKPLKPETGPMAELNAYIAFESRGQIRNVEIPADDPRALAAYEKGREFYFTRRGQFNFSCVTCHGANSGNHVALRDPEPRLWSHHPLAGLSLQVGRDRRPAPPLQGLQRTGAGQGLRGRRRGVPQPGVLHDLHGQRSAPERARRTQITTGGRAATARPSPGA